MILLSIRLFNLITLIPVTSNETDRISLVAQIFFAAILSSFSLL
jgi:hypothetical protein